jgi:hypothetical protein
MTKLTALISRSTYRMLKPLPPDGREPENCIHETPLTFPCADCIRENPYLRSAWARLKFWKND